MDYLGLFCMSRPFGNKEARKQKMRSKTVSSISIFVIVLVGGCAAVDWQNTLRRNTREGYQAFIAEHPESTQASIAKRRLENLDSAIKKGDVWHVDLIGGSSEDIRTALGNGWTPVDNQESQTLYSSGIITLKTGHSSVVHNTELSFTHWEDGKKPITSHFTGLSYDKNKEYLYFTGATIGNTKFERRCLFNKQWYKLAQLQYSQSAEALTLAGTRWLSTAETPQGWLYGYYFQNGGVLGTMSWKRGFSKFEPDVWEFWKTDMSKNTDNNHWALKDGIVHMYVGLHHEWGQLVGDEIRCEASAFGATVVTNSMVLRRKDKEPLLAHETEVTLQSHTRANQAKGREVTGANQQEENEIAARRRLQIAQILPAVKAFAENWHRLKVGMTTTETFQIINSFAPNFDPMLDLPGASYSFYYTVTDRQVINQLVERGLCPKSDAPEVHIHASIAFDNNKRLLDWSPRACR